MDIVKIGNLTAEENEEIVKVGKLLKEINVGFDEGTINDLNEDDVSLLKALDEVLDSLLAKVVK